MTTNSMAAGPAKGELALYRIDAGAAGLLPGLLPGLVTGLLRARKPRRASGALAACATVAAPAMIAAIAAIAALSALPAPAFASETLARQRNCLNCHGMERKVVGPGFKQVAERYAGKKEAPAYLAEKIVQGGAGAWGPVAMAANPQVSKEEAARLAAWVLSLK